MSNFIDELKRKDHKRYLGGLDFFKYIGPGLLVTVGFIDPGNWASMGCHTFYDNVDCLTA